MKRDIICGIYKIVNPIGMIYIGQTINWHRRKSSYVNMQSKGQRKIFTSFEIHGVDKHTFELIHECFSNELNHLEKYYIELYDCFDTPNGLNATSGGNANNKISVDTRHRQSKAAIGRKLTDEAKKKVSMSLIGNKRNLGKTTTEEHKRARSLFTKGRKMSPEAIEKTRQANIGKKLSEETKKKLSMWNKGKKKSKEEIQKQCKIILNTETGIIYFGAKEVSEQMGCSELSASRRLNGYLKNNTSFIYI